MKNWIKVDTFDLNQGKDETIRGAKIKVFLSPYDVPDAVSGNYDKEIARFVIAFHYVSDEPYFRETLDDTISVRLGKKSQRVLAIEVNVDALKAKRLQLEVNTIDLVTGALDKLANRAPSNWTAQRRFGITKDIINRNRANLFAGVCGDSVSN
jgi:hypothetical protein